MDIQKFQKIVGTSVKKVKSKKLERASSSLRPLAELLLQWYERKLAEEVVKKYDQNN